MDYYIPRIGERVKFTEESVKYSPPFSEYQTHKDKEFIVSNRVDYPSSNYIKFTLSYLEQVDPSAAITCSMELNTDERGLDEVLMVPVFKQVEVVAAQETIIPKNNNGRKTCHWCGSPTKVIYGANSHWDGCSNTNCSHKWD